MSEITNILVVGIGGRGVMTATEILAEAAIALGHDVKTEVAGMAQRGGSSRRTCASVRRCCRRRSRRAKPTSCSASNRPEYMRWCHMLRPAGLAFMNTGRLKPPVVELGLFDYPDDPVQQMKDAGTRVYAFDATALALGLGDIRLGNTVMLGAIADRCRFPPRRWRSACCSALRASRQRSSSRTAGLCRRPRSRRRGREGGCGTGLIYGKISHPIKGKGGATSPSVLFSRLT